MLLKRELLEIKPPPPPPPPKKKKKKKKSNTRKKERESFFQIAKLLDEVNAVIITLVPKVPSPSMREFRPVAYCKTM
jgi:hypothetical protein